MSNEKIPEEIIKKIFQKYPAVEGASDSAFELRARNANRRSAAQFGYHLAASTRSTEGWVVIDEEPPTAGQLVWLIEDGGVMLEAFRWVPRGHNGNEHPYFYGMKTKQTVSPYEVTHYRPLPSPPIK